MTPSWVFGEVYSPGYLRERLQSEAVRELEGLEDGSIHCKVSKSHKSVAPQIADAAQARRSKESLRKIESVGSLGVSCIHVVRNRVRTIIRNPVQVVIRSHIETVGRIEAGWGARSSYTTNNCLGAKQSADDDQPAAI